jgi:hypothetical protein
LTGSVAGYRLSLARFFAEDLKDALDTRLTEGTAAPEVGAADTYGLSAHR